MQRSSLNLANVVRTTALNRAILRPVSVLSRGITTSTVSPTEELALLNKQRNLRPNSPWHIYQPQLTAITSIANRATGAGLSVGIYALFIGHLVLPAFGVPFDSATIVSTFADFPEWFKLSAKAIVAYPAAFHSLNGLRHLSWDAGKLLDLKTSYAAGYTVLAATALSGTYLTFFL